MNKSICLLILLLAPLSLQAQTIKDYIDNDWPDNRYQVHNDGTVIDKVTGLMWMQCSLGQTYADGTCSNAADATEHTWQAALEAAEDYTFATYSDWRLPNIKELSSLAARDRHGPSINSSIFPNTPSDWYWSASPNAGNSSDAWRLYFSYGYDYLNNRNHYHHVRLVRSGQ